MKRWRVGDVQRLGAGGGAGETWGVALYDETGKPCVTFGYPKETDAKAGRLRDQGSGITTVDRIRPPPSNYTACCCCVPCRRGSSRRACR
jgi:hypothetical protein